MLRLRALKVRFLGPKTEAPPNGCFVYLFSESPSLSAGPRDEDQGYDGYEAAAVEAARTSGMCTSQWPEQGRATSVLAALASAKRRPYMAALVPPGSEKGMTELRPYVLL